MTEIVIGVITAGAAGVIGVWAAAQAAAERASRLRPVVVEADRKRRRRRPTA